MTAKPGSNVSSGLICVCSARRLLPAHKAAAISNSPPATNMTTPGEETYPKAFSPHHGPTRPAARIRTRASAMTTMKQAAVCPRMGS